MKSKNIISILACLIIAIGCSRDNEAVEIYEDQQSVFITMELYSGTSRSTSSYALQDGVLGEAEYIIDHLRVYVFASDGTLDKMEIYENLNANHLVNQTIEVPKDLSKELYFVANEPAQLSDDLDQITSSDELKEIEFTIADQMNEIHNGAATFSSDDFLMPLTAAYSVQNAMADLNIYVGLSRAVARVDLYLTKDSSAASRSVKLDGTTLLRVHNVSHDSKLIAGDIPTVSTFKSLEESSSDITISTAQYERILSVYTAERKYETSNSITIEVDGLIEGGSRVESKSVTLGDAGTLTQINRNYLYRIYGSYNGTEIVADDLEIMEWDDVEIDAEIEGVMMAVDSQVAMDWLRNGNTYASKSISFGSNKPISFYLPVTLSSDDSSIPDYEFTLFEFEDMSAGKSYDLKKIALSNNYIFATSWIESATIHFTSPQSGYINFVYTPVKVSYKIQSYPIRIKSDNVTKQMKAVYDNGYLPATLLSDDWAKRAPGGVIFAKRGEGNHPTTTADILDRDDDGYYRGEYQATAEEGAAYCTNLFGEGWYIPSYADMVEIASLYDMLGVSYRFQNNGSAEDSGELTEARYWTSSASSSYPGWHWTADFMLRDYMIENLMERREGSESHFVRCAKDLQ
ncbi:MAG: hypothetical protein R3Y44_06105 [Rikenellaceae bacterium]